MKKLVILLLMILLLGCSMLKDAENDSPEKSSSESIESFLDTTENNISNANSSPEYFIDPSFPDVERDYAHVYPESLELIDKIKKRYLFYPTDLCINLNKMTIRWVADNGVGLDSTIITDQDSEYFVKLDRSIYKGTLTEISENIYSSKGEFMPTMLSLNQPLSEDIDFYLIIEDRKAFIVLDEMSIEELMNYYSASYYYWHDHENE